MKIERIIILITILLPLCFYGRAIDEEIIVFFQPDVIELPMGQDSALLNEINAPEAVLDCLQSIDVIKIFKALPDFNPADRGCPIQHESGWSNESSASPGAIAQSSYPKTSAFNSSAKIAVRGSNVYVVYVKGNYPDRPNEVRCLRSTDGRLSLLCRPNIRSQLEIQL